MKTYCKSLPRSPSSVAWPLSLPSRSVRAREFWQRVCLVVCDDRLIDGKYEDILNETVRLLLKTPLIVVSPTGDWRDYLKAIGAGAFDYLAYPPIPGDLPRSISNALTLRTDGGFQDATIKFSNSAREGIL
jgi:DNA-binding NtrC family response regulator